MGRETRLTRFVLDICWFYQQIPLDLPYIIFIIIGDLIYLENYRATLAHKINHNFHYNCTEWFFQHPRHGLIPSIIATSDIEKGQELYLHYGKYVF